MEQKNTYYGVIDRFLLRNDIKDAVKSNAVEVKNTVIMKNSLIMKADTLNQVMENIISHARKNMLEFIKKDQKERAKCFDELYACVQCKGINEFHIEITKVYSTKEIDNATGRLLLLM